MMHVISQNLKRLANFILFAAALTNEELDKVIKKLEDVLHDTGNFEPTKDQPLMFSEKGLGKIKHVENENFSRDKDMMSVIKTLTRSISLAAKTGNEQMAYVLKQLEKAPDKWLNINLKGLDFQDAKTKVMRDGFEYLVELLHKPLPKKTVSPEELQEMKERGVL